MENELSEITNKQEITKKVLNKHLLHVLLPSSTSPSCPVITDLCLVLLHVLLPSSTSRSCPVIRDLCHALLLQVATLPLICFVLVLQLAIPFVLELRSVAFHFHSSSQLCLHNSETMNLCFCFVPELVDQSHFHHSWSGTSAMK